jgi:hypothetical protein
MAIQECSKYHIDCFWNKEYTRLTYIQEQFNDAAKLAEWQAIGYQNVATGYMCDMRSPQPSWNNQIVDIFKHKGWQDIGTSYYRMPAGAILPTHSDLYLKYVKIFNLQGQEHSIRRAIVFLEDWQSGHYLECAGEPITQWRAGDTVEWTYDTPHLAANTGITPRYTLQITGHL